MPAAAAPASAPTATPEVQRWIDAAKAHIAARDTAAAERDLTRARAAAGSDPDQLFEVAAAEATLASYSGDPERAAQALVTYLARTGERPRSVVEFWIHNMLMMLREAQGDIPAAIVECDQETLAGLRGTWAADGDEPREIHTWLKDTWHRAYLHRMLAERLTGSRRQATLRYAEAARRAYTRLAARAGHHDDSVAVLDAYFAALDGDKARALAAARRVDVAGDDDLEDLYLVLIALDAGGDAPGAAVVRQKILSSTAVYLGAGIVRHWVELDALPGPHAFTPHYPTGTAAN